MAGDSEVGLSITHTEVNEVVCKFPREDDPP